MCLAVPMKIKEINGMEAIAERDGVERNVRLDFIRDPKIGDNIMIHAGFAIEKVSEKEAAEDMDAFRELQEALASLS